MVDGMDFSHTSRLRGCPQKMQSLPTQPQSLSCPSQNAFGSDLAETADNRVTFARRSLVMATSDILMLADDQLYGILTQNLAISFPSSVFVSMGQTQRKLKALTR